MDNDEDRNLIFENNIMLTIHDDREPALAVTSPNFCKYKMLNLKH